MDCQKHLYSLEYRLSVFKKGGPVKEVQVGEMCEFCGLRRPYATGGRAAGGL